MRSVQSTVEHRIESYSESRFFSAMKGEYVVFAEQAHHIGPAYPSLSLHLLFYGVTHVIIVACHHHLFCCMDTSLQFFLATSIPTLFNILNEHLYISKSVEGWC